MAEALGGRHEVAGSVRDLYAQASAAGLGQAPVPQVIDHLATGGGAALADQRD